MNKPQTEEPVFQAVDTLAGPEKGTQFATAQVLKQLSSTLTAFNVFKDGAQTRLDPWEVDSLCVTEQSLKRAWLAFSQLHTDLAHRDRGASGR